MRSKTKQAGKRPKAPLSTASGTLGDLGEAGWIRRFAPAFRSGLPPSVEGIGDDCAVIPLPGGDSLVATTDLLIEEVHFIRDRIPPEDLGYKSLAVNLSDIAAMGGTPRFALLSLALPPATEVQWADRFMAGFAELADLTGVHLVGGDTTRSPGPVSISVTLLGTSPAHRLKRRSGARPGDVICVTGTLGDSAAGLRALLREREGKPVVLDPQDRAKLLARHFRPRAHLEEGRWLGSRPEVRSMMDLSDGLDADLPKLLEASQAGGARVELARLRFSPETERAASALGVDPAELAAVGGEDYCLLFTADRERFEELSRDYEARFGRAPIALGEVVAEGGVKYSRSGKAVELSSRGFEHFAR